LAILHTALFGTVERGEVRYRRDRVRKRKPTEKLWRRREKEEKKRRQVWTKIKDALLKEVNMSLSMRRRTMNHIFFKNKVQSSVSNGWSYSFMDGPPSSLKEGPPPFPFLYGWSSFFPCG